MESERKILFEHTKLDYFECCAFLVLTEIFPNKYPKLEILDKPDLQGTEVGVEVTIANNRRFQEAQKNWSKANNCTDEKKKTKYIERMMQLGVVYTGGVQLWNIPPSSIECVKEAVDTKIEKLKKGGYKRFEYYELFIFADLWMYEEKVECLKKYFSENDVYKHYKCIYVLEEGYHLHIFQKDNYNDIVIDESEQTERNIRARLMVEEKENK